LHEVKVAGTDCYTPTLKPYQSTPQCTFTRAITEADLYEAAINVSATVTAFAAFTSNSTARLPVTLSAYTFVVLPAMQMVEVRLLPSWQLAGASTVAAAAQLLPLALLACGQAAHSLRCRSGIPL
jgi:hypothetical protein